MPIGKIVFNLETEKRDFEAATKYLDVYLCLWDLRQRFREILKYNDHNYSEETLFAIEEIRDFLNMLLEDRGVNIDLIP